MNESISDEATRVAGPTSKPGAYALSVVAIVVAMVAALWAVVGWGLSDRAINEARVAARSKGAAAAPDVPSTMNVTLSEFKIAPEVIALRAGSASLSLTNLGNVDHDIRVDGTELMTPSIAPGAHATFDLSSLPPGTFHLSCHIAGHAEAGMNATLTLSAGTGAVAEPHTAMDMAGAGGANTGRSSHPTMTPAEITAMDLKMLATTKAFPAATEGLGAQDLAPTILADGTKQFELTAKVVSWEVSPGKRVQAWTYNGTVPGPTLRVGVGDKVSVVLHNQLPESTVVHFHGIELPNAMDGVPGITQDPVRPGSDFTYSFVAKSPAVGMYHSHHNAVTQVPNGLAGAFIIGSMPLPTGVKVAQEHVMMLNDAGVIGYSLNGKSFPATAPIVAKQGEWIEVHYMNEGQQVHPMHLHGIPQLVIAQDGFPLANPQLEDTVLVAPGQRFTVLVHATELGTWAWHCHVLSHAETASGMFGMVTALIVA